MRARSRALTALLAAVAVILTTGLAIASPAGASPATTGSGAVAGRVLVQYRADTPVETRASLERAHGLSKVRKLDRIGVEVLQTRPGDEAATIAALQRSGRVVFAERDGRTTAAAVTPNDYWWPQQWGPVKVNAPRAWSATTGASSVVVAVLDSGVSAHPDLSGKLTAGYDFINLDSSPIDDNGHGTLAAGVVGALSNNGIGVASLCWQCKIMPVKVLAADGSGSYSALADGIVWAADRGAKVITMSLSGDDDSAALRSAVQYARNKGAVLTAAAGNAGCDCRSFPAAFPEVISVGASDTTDARASYSNYGSWVDVAAPGTNYTTTMSGAYGSFSGTSSATPVVAGVLALLRSAAPLASVGAIETALLSTAAPVGYVATGRIDAAAALAAVTGVPITTGFPLTGAIGAMYPSVASVLGAPTSAEFSVPGGRAQSFQGGDMLWSVATGAREVHGGILGRYRTLAGPSSPLGLPTTHETATPGGYGRYNHFQGGSIYWSPATAAFEVRGAIRGAWARLGWERSALGYPVTGELGTPDGVGRFNHFQTGSVYWTPSTGAVEVRGAIRATWARLGWERSALGYPVTDELGTPDGVGRFNHFQTGSVYWTPLTGAREVRGAIRGHWAALGWERGLGYPVSDEYDVPGGRRNDFQRGSIVWDAGTGATRVV